MLIECSTRHFLLTSELLNGARAYHTLIVYDSIRVWIFLTALNCIRLVIDILVVITQTTMVIFVITIIVIFINLDPLSKIGRCIA